MILLVLLVLFVAVPAVEIATFIKVGASIGVFNTIAFTFLTAVLGVVLVRWQGLQTLDDLRRAMEEGRPPAVEMVAAGLLLLAGVLLLVPGFVTDAVGFLLLVPPLRRAIAVALLPRVFTEAEVHVRRTPTGATIIEAEVVEMPDEPDTGTDVLSPPRRPPADDEGAGGSPWRRG